MLDDSDTETGRTIMTKTLKLTAAQTTGLLYASEHGRLLGSGSGQSTFTALEARGLVTGNHSRTALTPAGWAWMRENGLQRPDQAQGRLSLEEALNEVARTADGMEAASETEITQCVKSWNRYNGGTRPDCTEARILAERESVEAPKASRTKIRRKPTTTSVSARLDRSGFGRNTVILRGTVVLSGFKVMNWINGAVRVTWSPGSEFDNLNGNAWSERTDAERAHMTGLYGEVLRDSGYAVQKIDQAVLVFPDAS